MPGVLFDLDGVFSVGDEPIPGAAEALEWIRRRGILHCFLTNTTSRSRKQLARKLAEMVGRIEPRQILSLTIIFDHDVIDGAPAARFARRLVELIESGYGLGEDQAAHQV